MRTNEERLVTTSLKVKGRTEFLVRFLSFFLWVLINLYVAFTTLWAIVLFLKCNCVSFTPPYYKRGLVKTLIDRTFKISNTWLGFYNDIQNLFAILHKNLYPVHVLDMLLHHYITKAVEGNDTRPLRGVEQQELPRHYVKILTSGIFLGVAQWRVRKLTNRFCKPIDFKFFYSTFKIKNLFNGKDPLPDRLHMCIIYKFSWASCDACFIG